MFKINFSYWYWLTNAMSKQNFWYTFRRWVFIYIILLQKEEKKHKNFEIIRLLSIFVHIWIRFEFLYDSYKFLCNSHKFLEANKQFINYIKKRDESFSIECEIGTWTVKKFTGFYFIFLVWYERNWDICRSLNFKVYIQEI